MNITTVIIKTRFHIFTSPLYVKLTWRLLYFFLRRKNAGISHGSFSFPSFDLPPSLSLSFVELLELEELPKIGLTLSSSMSESPEDPACDDEARFTGGEKSFRVAGSSMSRPGDFLPEV